MKLSVSERCSAIRPSPTLAVDTKAKAMRAAGIDVIGLGAGEPDFDTPEYICNAAKRAIDSGKTRYTPVSGIDVLKQAICDKLLRDNSLAYTPDQIIVTSGAKQALFNVFQAILDPGDEVIIPSPYWVSYPELVRMAGGVPVLVPASEDEHFIVPAEKMAEYITPATKAILINTPNNPNGCVWGREVLEGIAQLALDNELWVISDEIYEKLIYAGEEHVSIASVNEKIKAQTFVINGFSKAYAMTGWRLGYCAGPKKIIKAMTAFQSHSTSNPNSITQYAGYAALTEDFGDIIAAMRSEFDVRRTHMVMGINSIPGLSCRTPRGAFYIMMNITGVKGRRLGGTMIDSSDAFASLLLEYSKVAVVPGSAFGSDDHVRMSYATSLENIDEALKRIERFVEALEK